MNVKDLRTLVDNLEEYIHVPGGIERLKKAILHLAVSGQLVPQDPSEGTGKELCGRILVEKTKLIEEGKLRKQTPQPEISVDEVPFIIPESWKWARLNDTYDVRDGTHDTPKYVAEGYPLVTSKNLSSGKLDMSNVKLISSADHLGIKARSEVSKNDVLFAMIGSIGNPVIVDTEQEFSIKNVALFKPYLVTLYSPEWLLINLLIAQNEMKQQSAGGVQAFVSLGFVRSYPSPVPPYSEQLRIIKKIESIFTLIDKLSIEYKYEQLERRKLVVASLTIFAKGEGRLALDQLTEIIKTKEDAAELRNTILHLAVSGQLVPQDPSEGTGEELYEQIQAEKAALVADGTLKKQKLLPAVSREEEPFKIPETWKWVRLGNLGDFGSGSTPMRGKDKYYDGDINWFKSGELTDTFMTQKSEENIKQLALKECSLRLNKPGDILIAMYGATAGKLGLLEVEGTTNQAVCGFTLQTNIDRLFVFNTLLATRASLIEKSSGAAQPNISKVKIINHLFVLPPLKEQARIVKKTSQLLELVKQLEFHLDKR